MDAQGAVAGDRDLRMRVGRRQAHARAVAGEVGDGRETVGAERTETVRTGPAADLLHAQPEQLLAGESGGGALVGDELQGRLPVMISGMPSMSMSAMVVSE